jgi:GT2 family glycosyltransferase
MECVESLLCQTRRLDAILVIDNASTDGTKEMIEAKFRDRAELVRLPANTGSAGGFHAGIRMAYDRGYDWVWCMDNDAEPAKDSLEALTVSPAFLNPAVGALAARLVDQHSRFQVMHHKRLIPFDRSALANDNADRRLEIPLVATGWAGVLIRRSTIQSVGLPRKELFVFWDDLEYTYRISRTFRIFLIPASRVVHKSDSRLQGSLLGGRLKSIRWPSNQPWRTYYEIRNQVFFVTRYGDYWTVPIMLAHIVARRIAGILLFDDCKLGRIKILWRATKNGVLGRFDAGSGSRFSI